ncbi:site-2 protease family protein [Iocasia frigidifontis]|uniref:Site-2 protease family protein n=1 Tax=Iocasia fonsfrigidae TaxID=2682810 RepID=A0A8A7KK49_9FIRM|nr:MULTISPECIES: site-2 protease family protein [Halanaerobiaceae]AZO96752.1 site-2 protease family protein [Halocella sp. SP3-1]MTI60784.1 site-2 protease family protein [Bacillota bacterium]QTL99999.1 site-2 protease family protein [Iocasia fonsfrigidae]
MELILAIPILLLSLSFHEFSHGKASDMLGDPTPRMMGRLTLNPLVHLDLVGTLVLIITRRFGWAKPVIVNPRYYQNQRQGMMLVGMAGPAANFVLAFVFAMLLRSFSLITGQPLGSLLFQINYLGPGNIVEVLVNFLFLGVLMNLGLALFNLIPVPPLDGSKILRGFLPPKFDRYLYQLEGPVGMIILLVLLYTGILSSIITPILGILVNILL